MCFLYHNCFHHPSSLDFSWKPLAASAHLELFGLSCCPLLARKISRRSNAFQKSRERQMMEGSLCTLSHYPHSRWIAESNIEGFRRRRILWAFKPQSSSWASSFLSLFLWWMMDPRFTSCSIVLTEIGGGPDPCHRWLYLRSWCGPSWIALSPRGCPLIQTGSFRAF